MEKSNSILSTKILILFYFFVFIILSSCDLDEISKINDVKVKTETRIALPLAYGTVELQSLIDYLGSDDSMFIPDKDGFYSFEPTIIDFEFPDTYSFQGSLLNYLSHLELRIESENRLPLGVSIELVFSDTVLSKKVGPSIFCELIEPAKIDQNGKVSEASHHVENVVLTNELISEYQKANSIQTIIRLYLPEMENKPIYLNQKDFLSMNIGLVVQAKTTEN